MILAFPLLGTASWETKVAAGLSMPLAKSWTMHKNADDTYAIYSPTGKESDLARATAAYLAQCSEAGEAVINCYPSLPLV